MFTPSPNPSPTALAYICEWCNRLTEDQKVALLEGFLGPVKSDLMVEIKLLLRRRMEAKIAIVRLERALHEIKNIVLEGLAVPFESFPEREE